MPGARLPPLHVVSNFQSSRRKLPTVQVDDSDISSGDNTSLAHNKPQPSSPASDDSYTTLQCEGSQCSLEMKATAALDRFGGWVFRLIRVFDANGIVGTTKSPLVRCFILESPFGCARGTLILLIEFGTAGNWADEIYWLGEGEGCDA